ncbi:hypothetical protein [Sphingomonas sp. M1A8_2b]
MRVLRTIGVGFVSLFICLSSVSAAYVDLVCRAVAIAGMGPRIENIHQMLGENVTDVSKIKIYISRDGDRLFAQSNYLSAKSDKPGERWEYPTKILVPVGHMKDLSALLMNIVFDSQPNFKQRAKLNAAMSKVEFYVDPAALDIHGRAPIDLTEAHILRLATDTQTLASRDLKLEILNEPPPALIETLDGCCLKGRPPGERLTILNRLDAYKISKNKTKLLNMVIDSTTRDTIADSEALSAMAVEHKANSAKEWDAALGNALAQAKGQTLIALTHVAQGKVVIEDAKGVAQYSIPLDEFHARARLADVQLILIGCETIKSAKASLIPVAIVGKYNTADAARRLATAMETATTAKSLLSAMAHEKLEIVVQKGNWDKGAIGAGVFKRLPDRLVRVFDFG